MRGIGLVTQGEGRMYAGRGEENERKKGKGE
jgi:hypothetical protein